MGNAIVLNGYRSKWQKKTTVFSLRLQNCLEQGNPCSSGLPGKHWLHNVREGEAVGCIHTPRSGLGFAGGGSRAVGLWIEEKYKRHCTCSCRFRPPWMGSEEKAGMQNGPWTGRQLAIKSEEKALVVSGVHTVKASWFLSVAWMSSFFCCPWQCWGFSGLIFYSGTSNCVCSLLNIGVTKSEHSLVCGF